MRKGIIGTWMTWAIRLRVVQGTDTGQSVGYIIIYLNNSSSLDYSMVSTSLPHMLSHLIFITTPQGGFLFVEDQVNEFLPPHWAIGSHKRIFLRWA